MRAVTITTALATVLLLAGNAPGADNKALVHYLSVPVVEGTGIYASVVSLLDGNAGIHTDIAAYTNLGLLAVEGTLGLVTVFLDGNGRKKMRTVHRVMGFVITAAAVWLGAANSLDHTDPAVQATSYSYAALTTVPILMFSF